MEEGSGLSRGDLATPAAMVQLLARLKAEAVRGGRVLAWILILIGLINIDDHSAARTLGQMQ